MNVKRLKLVHSEVQYRAISKFLNQHCQDRSWCNRGLGLVRARDINGLISLAREVDESLLNGSFLGSSGLGAYSSTRTPASIFKRDSQFVAMVTKYPYDECQRPGFDPDAKALETLRKDERRNKRLNTIFRGYRIRGAWRHPAHAIMSDIIHRTLGPEPVFDEMIHYCDFSAGANVGISGQATHVGVKLSAPLTVTPSCVPYLYRAVRGNEQLKDVLMALYKSKHAGALTDPARNWLDYDEFASVVAWVENNDVCCVPKNSETSRTIAKEPTGNSFVQKGVDGWMRERLRTKLNLDLTDQSINQVMAREGSLDVYDPYVTIDVKSASNGVITELVRYLAPSEWFSFLNALRSPAGRWPNGEINRWELFSSMGNGFTFPLETLIFSAAVMAASRLTRNPCDFRVYGDDIICRQSIALLVIEILRSCGFRTNNEKTFVFGPFRESCGANWYEGTDVTPVYWRRRIESRSALHAIHNAHSDHPGVQESLRTFDKMIPCVVPDDQAYGWVTDQAFRVPQDLWLSHKSVTWRRDTQSFRFPMLVTTPVRDRDFGVHLRGDHYKHIRWFSLIRGASCGDEFLKRRATSVFYKHPSTDARLECEFAAGRRIPWYWNADAVHSLDLLTRAGMQQQRAIKQVRTWYPD